MRPKKGLIVALDVPTAKDARRLARALAGTTGLFKIGSELFTAEGPKVVEEVAAEGGSVFLDLKFHDIPNTVAAAVREAAKLGTFMINVHALGGLRMLEEARKAIEKSRTRPYLIAVTVLTSMKEEDLHAIGIPKKPNEAWAELRQAHHFVCRVCEPRPSALVRPGASHDAGTVGGIVERFQYERR